jgi:hypothetical protein
MTKSPDWNKRPKLQDLLDLYVITLDVGPAQARHVAKKNS